MVEAAPASIRRSLAPAIGLGVAAAAAGGLLASTVAVVSDPLWAWVATGAVLVQAAAAHRYAASGARPPGGRDEPDSATQSAALSAGHVVLLNAAGLLITVATKNFLFQIVLFAASLLLAWAWWSRDGGRATR